MPSVRITISHAKPWPSHVDSESTRNNQRCIAPSWRPPKNGAPRWAPRRQRATRSLSTKIVVPRHLEVDQVVVLPLAGSLRVRLLAVEHLLEQRVVGRFLVDHLVPRIELVAQDRVGRLEEADTALLQLDVVLAVAVDRLPAHV